MGLILRHEPINHHMASFRTTDNLCRSHRLTERTIEGVERMLTNFDKELARLGHYRAAYGKNAPKDLLGEKDMTEEEPLLAEAVLEEPLQF